MAEDANKPDDLPEEKDAKKDGTPQASGDTEVAGEAEAREGLEQQVLLAARGAASGAAGTLKGGFAAMRDVRAASRQHADAQRRVRSMTTTLEEDRAALVHRQDIEARYEDIVREKTAERDEASQTMARAQQTVEGLEAEAASQEERLAAMRAQHEQELRPYRRVMETSRGRAADAGQSVAEAKRAVKGAEAQVKEATDARTQGIAQANRSLDNSQERLRRVQEDLRRAQSTPGTKADAVAQLQRESVAELAHVEAARAEVANATRSAQEAVEKAQMHLWTQKQSLECAQADADAARRDYEAHKAEHDRLAAEATQQEKELEASARKCRDDAQAARAEHDGAADVYDDAQAQLDEAEMIRSTPEETVRLASSIAQQEADLAAAQSELTELAAGEKTLRQHTRTERYILVAVAVAVVAVVAAIVMALLL